MPLTQRRKCEWKQFRVQKQKKGSWRKGKFVAENPFLFLIYLLIPAFLPLTYLQPCLPALSAIIKKFNWYYCGVLLLFLHTRLILFCRFFMWIREISCIVIASQWFFEWISIQSFALFSPASIEMRKYAYVAAIVSNFFW